MNKSNAGGANELTDGGNKTQHGVVKTPTLAEDTDGKQSPCKELKC